MRAGREDLGDTRGPQALFSNAECGTQPSAASADHNAVVLVGFVVVSSHVRNSLKREAGNGENAGGGSAVGHDGGCNQ